MVRRLFVRFDQAGGRKRRLVVETPFPYGLEPDSGIQFSKLGTDRVQFSCEFRIAPCFALSWSAAAKELAARQALVDFNPAHHANHLTLFNSQIANSSLFREAC
jgi:hypothetical protein